MDLSNWLTEKTAFHLNDLIFLLAIKADNPKYALHLFPSTLYYQNVVLKLKQDSINFHTTKKPEKLHSQAFQFHSWRIQESNQCWNSIRISAIK